MDPTILRGAFFLSALLGLGLGLLGLQGARLLFRSKSLIQARPQEFHHQPDSAVPRCGGFGIALVLIVIELALLVSSPRSEAVRALLICLLFFLLGAWDDLRPLGAKRKLAGQFCIAFLAWTCDLHIETLRFGAWEVTNPLLLFGATMVWLVALPNLINLIDGADGVAAGISLIGLWVIAIVGNALDLWLLVGAVSGAIFAFLRYNWPPARVYLGDGGAYLLGSLLGLTSLWSHSKANLGVSLAGCILVLALPIADMLHAILRRAWNGLPLFRADREHLHHRLQKMGFSRRSLALFVYGFTGLFALVALAVARGGTRGLILGPLLVGAALAWVFRYSGVHPTLGRLTAWRTQFRIRSRVQHALREGRGLVRQAEDCRPVQDMREDLSSVARRLGFEDVLIVEVAEHLVFPSGLSMVTLAGACPQERLVFLARPERFPSDGMRMVAEIVAEAWLRAHYTRNGSAKRDSNVLVRTPAGLAQCSIAPGVRPIPALLGEQGEQREPLKDRRTVVQHGAKYYQPVDSKEVGGMHIST